MSARIRFAVETLEGRALLATLSFPSGMVTGIANVDGQVDPQSLPLGSQQIMPALPSNGMLNDNLGVVFTSVGLASNDLYYTPNSVDHYGNEVTEMHISSEVSAPLPNPRAGTATVVAGTGTANPGAFIPASIDPGPGDQAGEKETIEIQTLAMIDGNNNGDPTDAHYQVQYNAGQGPVTVFSGPAVLPTHSEFTDRANITFTANVGQQFLLSMSESAEQDTTDPNGNSSGAIVLDVQLSVLKVQGLGQSPGGGTVDYSKPVSDAALRAKLQAVADALGWDISVFADDPNYVPPGASRKGLDLQKRGADFHVNGLSDAQVFAALKSWAGLDSGYEVIEYGPSTKSGGSRIHIGRFNSRRPSLFLVEGLTRKGRGHSTLVP